MLLSGAAPFVGPLQYVSGASGPMLEAPPPVQGADDLWYGTGKTDHWSEGDNWQLGHPPGTANSAVFSSRVNGVNYNNPCEVDSAAAFPIAGMSLNNLFSAQITVDSGVTVETSSGFHFALGTKANIAFSASSSTLKADGGSTFYDFSFTGQNGTVTIASGAVLGLFNPDTSATTANFDIHGGLNVQSNLQVTFQGAAGIKVASGASMNISNLPNPTAYTLLATSGTGIIENSGTFTAQVGTSSQPTIAMAFLNHGTADIIGGKITFSETNASTGGYAYKMDGGSTNLSSGVQLGVAGYYQTAGTLDVTDTQAVDVNLLTAAAEIDGGKVKMGTATAFGGLSFLDGPVTFNGGELDVKIQGNGGAQDQLSCNQTVTIVQGSPLVATAVGTLQGGNEWEIIQATNGGVGKFDPITPPPPGIQGSEWLNGDTYTLLN